MRNAIKQQKYNYIDHFTQLGYDIPRPSGICIFLLEALLLIRTVFLSWYIATIKRASALFTPVLPPSGIYTPDNTSSMASVFMVLLLVPVNLYVYLHIQCMSICTYNVCLFGHANHHNKHDLHYFCAFSDFCMSI